MKFRSSALAAPLLVIFFYQVAVESQSPLANSMKAAIDNYRFDLLSKNLARAFRRRWRRSANCGRSFEPSITFAI